MDENMITSDLNETASIAGQSDISLRSRPSRGPYPKRMVTEDDDSLENSEDEDDFDPEESDNDDVTEIDDDDYEPGSASGSRKSPRIRQKVESRIPLELRRDHMTVEEVAEEQLRMQRERNRRAQQNRETRSNTKGDTKVEFFDTYRGGKYEGRGCKVAMFRNYIFHSSRKGKNGKFYWRCPSRDCHCYLTLLNEKFCAISGEHSHPSNAAEVRAQIERRKAKKEREQLSREKRLEALKQKEIERRNNSVNGIKDAVDGASATPTTAEKKKEIIKNIWKGDKPPARPVGLLPPRNRREAVEGLDELDADEIDNLPTNLNFDMGFFSDFCTKLDKLFSEIQSFGLLNDSLVRDWTTVKDQVKSVAKARIKIKDQRYRAMRVKLDKAVVERNVAVETKRIVDQKISNLNIAGAELLINQIKELQGKDSVFQIVNGEVVPKEVDEYKEKYEKAVKERDALKFKLKNIASAAASSMALFGMSMNDDDTADSNHNSADSTPTAAVMSSSQVPTRTDARSASSQNNSPSVGSNQPTARPQIGQSNASVTQGNIVPCGGHAVTNSNQVHQQPQVLMTLPTYSQTIQHAASLASFHHGWQ